MAVKTNFKSNGKDYYRITYDIGVDSNGKRIRKQFVGKSKKEAEQKKLDYINKINSGISDTKTRFLGKTMKIWMFEVVKVGQIKPTSFARYEGIFSNYIEKSPIACISLEKLQPIDIQRYYNTLFKSGKSSNIINNLNKLLKQFLNYCVDSGYILKNPCDGKKVIIPKDNKIRRENKILPIFSRDEVINILRQKEDTKIRYISLISYATGMRKGEILGLKESDIDYTNNEIHIRRAMVTTYIFDENGKKHKETFLDDTKTYTSERDIPLPKSLIPIINAAISLKKRDILKAGNSFNENNKDLLFLSENGEYIEASNIDKSWIYFLKRCRVNHKKFHALRHTYATIQFENEIPLLTISKLLGHASIDITASTYTHVMKKEKEKAIETLSLLI
ncbi:site-specific integrase [Clostridium botulinum]|uniref:tyrosine-type recombinase/integrase n=1 Tax=Clostridium botulinum TaxID=1491 RepID=UPI00016BBD63|nr:site-specific integrase [Clostridium botulinum]EDT87475.1 phage integrase [Clostridium botulinum Bf]MBN3409975.1 site-specific integrase [Clostridium botulinum]MBY6797111.1 site-specific integrase [Clostridium botulinum]MBY6866467.1 site-specific integrase [Clostridium botulinum]MBY6872963.1 site-specific integrase [Clostridium botulinum]